MQSEKKGGKTRTLESSDSRERGGVTSAEEWATTPGHTEPLVWGFLDESLGNFPSCHVSDIATGPIDCIFHTLSMVR
jgi:hypothetical protein